MNHFRISRYWLFQLGGWGSFALIHTFFAYFFERLTERQEIQDFFGRLGIFIVIGLLSTHLMRFVIIKINTLQKPFIFCNLCSTGIKTRASTTVGFICFISNRARSPNNNCSLSWVLDIPNPLELAAPFK